MSLTYKNARVVYVECYCDICGGEMKADTAVVLAVYPPLYPHKCSKCGATKDLREMYPTIKYVVENSEVEAKPV